MADEFAINPPNAPLGHVDGNRVIIDRSWYRYFAQVQAVTGGGLVAALRDAEYLTYSPSLALPNARNFTGGTGLTLALTSSDATLNLDDTAVTPATYGSSSAVGSFTVDQQGRLTLASNIAIDPAAIGAVTSVGASGGTTGLTFTGSPITGAGVLTLGGTLDEVNGGTGFSSYIAGDLIYAASGTVLARLGIGLSNTVLRSNGSAPSWGKVVLTTDVSGTLPVANGGSGAVTFTANKTLKGNGTSALASGSMTDTGSLITVDSGVGLAIARTAVTAPVANDGNVYSGTYTPTLAAIANVDALIAFACQYMRVGNVVTVSGRVDVDSTATATLTRFTMTVPVATAMTSGEQAGGAINSAFGGVFQGGSILASSAVVEVQFEPTTTGSRAMWFTYTYRVI